MTGELVIEMKKTKSTKRFDVYESVKSDAHITSLYINKAANAGETIKVAVSNGGE